MSVDTRSVAARIGEAFVAETETGVRARRRAQRYCAINADYVADKIGGDAQNL
jgi:hypothetical protein